MHSSGFPRQCRYTTVIHFFGEEIAYAHFESRSVDNFPFSTENGDGRNPQIIAFSDASFGTLRNSGSIESFVGILGIPLKRRDAILRKGNIISFHGKKIARVARSTAHAEGIALSNADDSTLSLQIAVAELLSGGFSSSFLRSSTDAVAILNPFRAPHQSIFDSSDNRRSSTISGRKAIFFTGEGHPSHFESLCGNCGRTGTLTFDSMMSSYAPPADSLEPQILAGLLLCDCANTIALLSRCNPNPPEKCYRLICAYFHDAQQFANMSFANAWYNLADTGTKLGPNVVAWGSFLQNGLFFYRVFES